MKGVCRIVLVIGLFVTMWTAFAPAAAAQAWPNGYSYRRTITINHAKVPNTDQTNFPVLISGTYADLATTSNGGYVTSASGYDIIFTSDAAGSNVLAFEQGSYSLTTGQINYWVKIPSLSSSVDTVIFMFYGNASVVTDQSNKTAVWNNGYVGVWHLPDGTTLSSNDSTSQGNNATNVNSVSAAAGQVDGGASFNGSNNYFNVGNPTNLQTISAFTATIWVKTTHLNSTAASPFLDKSAWSTSGFSLGDHGNWSTNIYFYILPGGSGGTCSSNGFICFPRSLVNDGNWHQIAGVYDPNAHTVSVYLDGVLKTSRASGTYTANTATNLTLGQFSGGAGSSLADEFRLSNAARSGDWIATEFNNQNSPSTFYTISSGAGGTSANPTISSLALTYATGASVTISGTNFGSSQGSSSVSLNGNSVAPISWSATSIVAPVPSGLPNSSASVLVTVGGVQSNAVGFTLRPQSLATPWSDQDIGSVGFTGSGGYASDVFSLKGSGTSIWGTADGMNFAYQSLSGDGTIIARLTGVQNGSSGAVTAGVMVRESLNAGSANAFTAYAISTTAMYLQKRSSTGGTTSSQQLSGSVSLPYWVKLVRSGSSFSGYGSTDGVNWVQIGSTQTISMATNVYLGLGVSNQSNSGIATATFDNVSINSSSNPAPAITSVSATTGSVGSQVVISGLAFGTTQGNSLVSLNGMPQTINNWSDTAITFTIVSGTTSGPLKVTVAPSLNDSNYVNFTVESSPLPIPWLDMDIGNTSPMGSGSYTSGAFSVSGAGAGAWSTADAIHFVYEPLSGDGYIIARLTALQNGGSSASAGVMIRETLSPSAVNAEGFYLRSTVSANMSERTTTGGSTSSQQLSGSVTLPYWFQLVRSGNSFTAYGSTNGANWVQIGSTQTITMGSNTYVGLVVDSSSNGSLTTATFDNVSVTPVSGPQSPVITSISPNAALVGASVTINGSNFGPTQSSSTVTFSGVTATVTSWSATALTATVPNGAITGNVIVTVGGLSTPGANFTVLKMPAISSLSPTSGGYGYSVTLTGTNYGSTQGSSTISFHGTNATSITSWSNTQIVAVVPSGSTTGAVSVTVNTVTSTSNPTFTVYNPVISSITPPSGQVGGTVTLSGTGFTSGQGNGVQFNGTTAAYITNWTDTSITVMVPTGATSGPVTVTAGGVTSAGVQFNVEPISVTSISPATGTTGISTTITGAGFGATQSTSSLAFNGFAVTSITSWSDTQIVAVVPDQATTGPISVTVAGITAQGPTYTVDALATVTDSLGHQSSYTAFIFGGKWYSTDATGTGCSTCTVRGLVHATYDSHGNVLTTTDEVGHTTTSTYDSSNNALSVSQPLNSNTTATTSYTYNSFGEVLTVTDPLGNVTTNTYDSHGNLLTVTSPAPASGVAASVTTFAYDTKGQLTQITDPLGHVSTLTYTTAGLIATVTDAQSNVTTYAYDARGNRTSITDPAGNVTTFAFDAGDRLTTITYPPPQSGQSSSTSTFAYDSRGRRTSATDQNGKTTSYSYDDADRMTSVTDAASSVTTYAYDTENNLLSISDANSHTTSFSYDAFGRVIQAIFPSNLSEFYAYDAISNLTSKTDRKGQTILYVYDALNRLTQKFYPDSSTTAYVYDLAGKVSQVNDPTGTYGFSYDNIGRMTGTTAQYSFLTGTTFTNAYTYDGASNRTGYTAPDGSTNTYSYDNLNRLSSLANSWAGSFGFNYDVLSRRTQMTRPNGINTNYSFDSLSRLLSVLHQAGGSTIDGASYTVDATGNRTSKADQLAGVTSNYSYDSIYELTLVTQAATQTESYTYDPVGNRLSSLNAATYNYNSSNQVTSKPNTTYTYDANGNTATKTDSSGTTSYTWDFENRLTGVTLPGAGGTVAFAYDPIGRRIQKAFTQATNTTITIYVYDGGNVAETTDGSGTVAARYVQGQGMDEPLATQQGGVASYYHADALGSITSLTSATGAPTASYTYDSFGKLVSSTGSQANPFHYTSRELDSETGLYYYRARYYDLSLGRFLSEDPIRFSGGSDFYSYAGNHAINFSDPTGLKQQIGPATSKYNCLAWGLGLNWVWVQPVYGKSPNAVLPHFGCKKIDCKDDVNCKARSKVEVFEDSGDTNNWHVERQTCDKGWTSKYGQAPLFDSIDDPDADYRSVYKPKGVVKATCWSCPVRPPKNLPLSPDIQYIHQ